MFRQGPREAQKGPVRVLSLLSASGGIRSLGLTLEFLIWDWPENLHFFFFFLLINLCNI